jgi:hypothetical protein
MHLFGAYMLVIVIGKCQNWHHSRIPLFQYIIKENVTLQRPKNVTTPEFYDGYRLFDRFVIYVFVCETKYGIVTSTT